jgi:hypothetical protein
MRFDIAAVESNVFVENQMFSFVEIIMMFPSFYKRYVKQYLVKAAKLFS